MKRIVLLAVILVFAASVAYAASVKTYLTSAK
jgi:hypothetical protein